MTLAGFPEEFRDDVRRLARALGRLEQGQLRVARANARLEVRRSLEALRRRLDAAYPPVPKAPRRRAAARPAEARARRLREAGWGEVVNRDLIVAVAAAGVRVRYLRGVGFFAPRWAVFAALDRRPGQPYNEARVRQCRASRNARQAILAAHALGGLPQQQGAP